MRFSIVKNKSGQVPPQSSCDFLPPGGTIGRSVDNNLVLPDEERAISRLQAIVHISADGECRITNRGNVTRVLLNDIPLERGRQVELQDGDVLGIDDYQIEVSALQQHAAPQAQPVAKAAAVAAAAAPTAAAKEKSAAPIPNEIWDSLVEEFTPNAPAAVTPPPVANPGNHPLLDTPARELNPADPLAQLAGDVDLRQLQQQQTDPAALFNTDTMRMFILSLSFSLFSSTSEVVPEVTTTGLPARSLKSLMSEPFFTSRRVPTTKMVSEKAACFWRSRLLVVEPHSKS